MNYKWKDSVISSYYHDENGRIHGTVFRVSFNDDIWYAQVNESKLGEYIDMKSAKNAIVKEVHRIDEILSPCTLDINVPVVSDGLYESMDCFSVCNGGNVSQLGENH
jgi:(2Fe-2S) ferredoxin